MSNSWPVIIKVLSNKSNKKNEITIPQTILEQSNPPERMKVSLLEHQVNCKANNTSNVIEMTPYLLHKLGLKKGFKCHANIHDDTLQLGPIIGTFVGDTYIDRLVIAQNAKKRTLELYKANNEANTILYFFTNRDVFFKQKKVRGTYYDIRAKRWKQHLFPFPTALYDRGSGSRRKRISLKGFRRRLEKVPSLKKVNAQHYFNKWDLYLRLQKHKELRPYIPVTMLYRKPSDLKRIFAVSKKIYVKKLVSSNGVSILRIEKLSPYRYKCTTFSGKVMSQTANSLFGVHHVLKKMYGNGKVILQQAINVLNVNNRNVDMRATVQRDGNDNLGITDITVRVGGKGSPVTSTRSGSICFQFERFFRKKLKYSEEKLNELRERIEEFLLTVYRCTEESYGKFAEIGIDFALDTKGNLKFIECNAKPAKTSLYKASDPVTIRKAFRYPLDYAKFISGF